MKTESKPSQDLPTIEQAPVVAVDNVRRPDGRKISFHVIINNRVFFVDAMRESKSSKSWDITAYKREYGTLSGFKKIEARAVEIALEIWKRVTMDLNGLIEAVQAAKQAEQDARDERYRLQEKIADLVGRESEGTVSKATDRFKVACTYKVNRTIDLKKWEKIKNDIPESVRPYIIKQKPSLDLKGYRWLEENMPDVFKIVARVITSRPAVVSLKITEVE